MDCDQVRDSGSILVDYATARAGFRRNIVLVYLMGLGALMGVCVVVLALGQIGPWRLLFNFVVYNACALPLSCFAYRRVSSNWLKAHVSGRAELLMEQAQSGAECAIKALSAVSDRRDPYTAGHQRRVSELAGAIAAELSLPLETVEGVKVAGMLHDMGKVTIPVEILCKPGKLSEYEFAMIKNHPRVDFEILEGIEFPWPVREAVLQHHERIDGSGYPEGLSGEEIVTEARILAVADVVEAMASHRPYRPARGIDEALAEIEEGRGSLYDARVADACRRLFNENRFELS
ncbi:MAG: HD-GYP domain-containing protein [Actinomycetota bacterium]